MKRTILVVAGEASGDALGAGLVRAAAAIDPGVRFVGVGGEAMRAAGVEILVDAREIAVVGVLEVLSHLPRILEARRVLRAALAREKPFRALLIDYPDFNLRFARDVVRAGVPVHYFVSPQVWAWRSGRVATIAKLVERMMVIFPFEEEIYRKAGVPAVFVGHPLVDSEPAPIPRALARQRLGAPPEGRLVALLPGSRASEIRSLLPILIEAAGRIRSSRPDVAAVIPIASTAPEGLIESIVSARGGDWARPVRGLFHEALDGADAAVVASGTATLQAGYRRTPMVVVYRIHPLTAFIGRRLVHLENIALVNLVAGSRVVPELIQESCTPEGIEAAIAPLLDDPAGAASMRGALAVVRERLGAPGAFERAARLVLEAPAPAARV